MWGSRSSLTFVPSGRGIVRVYFFSSRSLTSRPSSSFSEILTVCHVTTRLFQRKLTCACSFFMPGKSKVAVICAGIRRDGHRNVMQRTRTVRPERDSRNETQSLKHVQKDQDNGPTKRAVAYVDFFRFTLGGVAFLGVVTCCSGVKRDTTLDPAWGGSRDFTLRGSLASAACFFSRKVLHSSSSDLYSCSRGPWPVVGLDVCGRSPPRSAPCRGNEGTVDVDASLERRGGRGARSSTSS